MIKNPFSKKRLFKLLGFLAPFPFFVVPSKNMLYFNHISKSENLNYDIHPDYTFSLGLATPLNLMILTICFFCIIINDKKNLKPYLIDLLFLLITAFYYFVTSNSVKSLAFTSSIMAIQMAKYFCETTLGRVFLISYTKGFATFVFLHAISIYLDGVDFSTKTEGISFFGLEIYQGLISYPAAIAVFFGIALLAPKSMSQILYNRDNKFPQMIIYILLLISILYVLSFLTRRASLIVISISIILFLFQRTRGFKFYNRILIAITITFIFTFVVQSLLLNGLKAFNYSQMIKPRLDLYTDAISKYLNNGFTSKAFGYEDNWGIKHNTYIDILQHSGFVGLILALLIIIRIIKKQYAFKSNYKYDQTEYKLVLLFVVFSFLFDNFVNTAFSTPFYTVTCVCLINSVKSSLITAKDKPNAKG
tara:strand:- start:4183 stop:5439 length:1257 start_codon:yes stop_codon:yes gene_type:complete